MSFRQSGNYIACTATDGETNRLIIFEKNCRVKSEYALPESKVGYWLRVFKFDFQLIEFFRVRLKASSVIRS